MAIRRIITNGGSFDSELHLPSRTDNGSLLSLIVRTHLYQINPARGQATGTFVDGRDRFAIQKWPAREWDDYKDRFDDVCEMIWNGELYLTPPANLPAALRRDLMSSLQGASTKAPYIECSLDVQVTSVRRQAHVSLGVYRLADSETKTFRSYIEQRPGQDGGRMSNHDIYLEMHFDGAGATTNLRMFSTVAHEVGHVLGLNHPACSGNSTACYGAPGSANHNSIMGFGSNMLTTFSQPWVSRIGSHTGHRRGWTATLTRPNQPTLQEVLATYR